MITIINSSREMTKIENYKMTMSPEINTLKDVADGTIIEVDGWLMFVEKKENGEEVEILSILSKDGKTYSCQSATFKDSFLNIDKIMSGDPYSIKKISGTTKAGRPYIDCVLNA